MAVLGNACRYRPPRHYGNLICLKLCITGVNGSNKGKPMKKTDEHYIALALLWLTLGFAIAVLARMRGSEVLDITSALALNGAFPVSAFAGLLYRFFPLMKQSKMARPQFWLLSAGLAIMILGAWLTGEGYTADVPQFGMVLALGGVVLLAWIWWRERAPT
jgi:hypothetical protein